MEKEYNFIFIIYSCKKNLIKANTLINRFFNELLINLLKIKVIIIYGDTNIETKYKYIDDKYLVLNIKDDYNSLHLKTLYMFKIIINLFPKIIGCFKCDDDIILNINSIIFFIQSLDKFQINYSGFSCMVHEKQNNNIHMIQKGINIHSQNIITPASLYCGGPLYYLSNKSLNIIKTIEVVI